MQKTQKAEEEKPESPAMCHHAYQDTLEVHYTAGPDSSALWLNRMSDLCVLTMTLGYLLDLWLHPPEFTRNELILKVE